MSLEEIIRAAASRAETVRVRNALNAALWGCAVVTPVWRPGLPPRKRPGAALRLLRPGRRSRPVARRGLSLFHPSRPGPAAVGGVRVPAAGTLAAGAKGSAPRAGQPRTFRWARIHHTNRGGQALKAHLLVFDGDRIDLKKVISIVDRMPEIENWHVVFSNTICIASSTEAKRLASRFNDLLPGIRYLVSEVQSEKKGGRMNSTIFELMNAPSPAQREPA